MRLGIDRHYAGCLRGGDAHSNRHALAAPWSLEAVVAPRHGRIAMLAVTFGRECVTEDFVPVAHDDRLAAARAERRAAFAIVHVAGVDVAQSFGERDPARALERRS